MTLILETPHIVDSSANNGVDIGTCLGSPSLLLLEVKGLGV